MARFLPLEDWPTTASEAVALQRRLADRVHIQRPPTPIRTVAGADISYNRRSSRLYVAVVVVDLASMETISTATAVTEATFPYIPGLLSFREIPPILAAWERLEYEPDGVMVDGQGFAHPRRFGIACHLGLHLERPTFGCAKSILVGTHEALGEEEGSRAPLIHREEIVGAALRTKPRVRPVYVSVGNEIDLETAIDLTRRCEGGYRVPEPTRRAHLLVNELRSAS